MLYRKPHYSDKIEKLLGLPLSLKLRSSDVSTSSLRTSSRPLDSAGGLSLRIGSTVTSSKILFVRFSICKKILVEVNSLFHNY